MDYGHIDKWTDSLTTENRQMNRLMFWTNSSWILLTSIFSSLAFKRSHSAIYHRKLKSTICRPTDWTAQFLLRPRSTTCKSCDHYIVVT